MLRGLNLLITSRYHAGVLSSAEAVPQIAISHDQRLRDLYRDFEIDGEYFLEYSSPCLFQLLEQRVEYLLQNPGTQQELLRKNCQIHQIRAKRNQKLLGQIMNIQVMQ